MEIPDKPCWQVKKKIMDRQVVGQFDPDCTQDGNYKSRQCDRKRMCWCVDPNGVGLTGKTTYAESSVEECDRSMYLNHDSGTKIHKKASVKVYFVMALVCHSRFTCFLQ